MPGALLTSLSMQWYYMVRHRNRWSGSPEAKQSLAQTAMEHLAKLGVTKSVLEEIGDAGLVEVQIPYSEESSGWAA